MAGSRIQKGSFVAFYRKYGIFVIMLMLFILAAILNPNFLKPQNLMNILKQITVVAIIACVETMLIVSGMIDLSAGQVCGMAGCFAAGALVATDSLAAAFAVGILSAMLFSYVSGILVTVFDLPPFIATLAVMNISEGVVYLYTGATPITGVEKLRWLGQGQIFGVVPVMIVFMIAVILLVFLVMKHTRFGAYIYAIGGNERAALAAGINVKRNKRITFLFAGALVGLAGIILSSRMMSGQPNVGSGYEFDAITATIVGGTSFSGGSGTALCVVAGSIIIGLINNILNLMNVENYWQLIVKGAMIALAVILDMKTKKAVS